MKSSILDIKNIKVGHYTNLEQKTGCTVILSDIPATVGVDISGGAVSTRETALCEPSMQVEKVNGILLTGGSAFGLSATDGVIEYLSKRNIGIKTPYKYIPIVPSAVIFDLSSGDPNAFPNRENGIEACKNSSSEFFETGQVGVGTGATVGKVLGIENSMKGGVGTSSISLENGVLVSAISVTNAFGDIVDYETGKIIAGAIKNGEFLNTEKYMLSGKTLDFEFTQNTTLSVVVTNAKLSKAESKRLAHMAQNGISRSIVPCKSMLDGDMVFVMSTGEKDCDINILGNAASVVVSKSILDSVL